MSEDFTDSLLTGFVVLCWKRRYSCRELRPAICLEDGKNLYLVSNEVRIYLAHMHGGTKRKKKNPQSRQKVSDRFQPTSFRVQVT